MEEWKASPFGSFDDETDFDTALSDDAVGEGQSRSDDLEFDDADDDDVTDAVTLERPVVAPRAFGNFRLARPRCTRPNRPTRHSISRRGEAQDTRRHGRAIEGAQAVLHLPADHLKDQVRPCAGKEIRGNQILRETSSRPKGREGGRQAGRPKNGESRSKGE
jgi:hypothetical protein